MGVRPAFGRGLGGTGGSSGTTTWITRLIGLAVSATCEPFRDALSAVADGEAVPVGASALRGHLDGCARCTAFAAAIDDLHRRVRVAPAEPVPDLTARILAGVATPQAARRQRVAQRRLVLAVVGVVQLLVAVPALFAAGALAAHVTREVAIFDVALGVGFLVASRRPERAGGLLPVAAVAAGLVTLTSLGDIVVGATTWLQETTHLLEVVGTLLLWRLDRDRYRPSLRPTTA